MPGSFLTHLTETLEGISADGLYKRERMITSAQSGRIGKVLA